MLACARRLNQFLNSSPLNESDFPSPETLTEVVFPDAKSAPIETLLMLLYAADPSSCRTLSSFQFPRHKDEVCLFDIDARLSTSFCALKELH